VQPGSRPGFGDFVPVPVPAGILFLAGILAGIFQRKKSVSERKFEPKFHEPVNIFLKSFTTTVLYSAS
jgi:hypothetical protein